MSRKPTVAIVNTGGTILSRYDEASGGWVSKATTEDLIAKVPRVTELAQFRHVQHSQINAYRMDSGTVLELAERVASLVEDDTCDGVVVIHGTASMEETAYFLNLTIPGGKPVVLTGAQRRFDDPGADGPVNFLHAVRIAASPESRDRGVMVTFDGSIHGARDVLKVHNQSLAGFGSRDGGAIGFVTGTGLAYLARPDLRPQFEIPKSLKNVQLVKLVQGNDDLLLRACINASVDGIVVEGVGGGGMPDGPFEAVCDALERSIPVVIIPRMPRGGLFDDNGGGGIGDGDYALNGSSGNLIARGAIPGGYLSGLKARLLLLLALTKTSDRDEIREIFRHP